METKKPKPKMPRKVEINPQSHDIELWICDPGNEDDLPSVHVKIGEMTGEVCVTAKEAKRIGQWFSKLAVAIK